MSGHWPSKPVGDFPGPNNQRYIATDEFRAPKKGEFYFSPLNVEAFCAAADFLPYTRYWILVPVTAQSAAASPRMRRD